MDVVPGQLLRETKRAATYLVQSPLDFEGKMPTMSWLSTVASPNWENRAPRTLPIQGPTGYMLDVLTRLVVYRFPFRAALLLLLLLFMNIIAMCADDQVTKVTQVDPTALGSHALHRKNMKRHLQSTFSEAGNAHGVSKSVTMLPPSSASPCLEHRVRRIYNADRRLFPRMVVYHYGRQPMRVNDLMQIYKC